MHRCTPNILVNQTPICSSTGCFASPALSSYFAGDAIHLTLLWKDWMCPKVAL